MIKKLLKRLGIILITTTISVMASMSIMVNANEFETHRQMVDRLPREVQRVVDNYTFILDDKAEETIEKYGYTKQTAYGLHVTTDKVIVVNNYRYNRHKNENDYWYNIYYELTFYHEIGHAVDFATSEIGYRSQGQEFFNIYLQERDNLNFGLSQEYHKSLTQEFFANAFANYFYSAKTKQLLKENLPQTYTYIRDYIDR